MAEFIGARILEEKTLWQRTIQKKTTILFRITLCIDFFIC